MVDVAGKVAVVTGGAGGIGGALARRLVEAGASVVVVDRDRSGAEAVAAGISADAPDRAVAVAGDVSDESLLAQVLAVARTSFGPVDLFFANAGIGGVPGLDDSPDSEWSSMWEVNVMGQVRAARLLVPEWLERGTGYFVATASAAGLLTQIGSAPYSVTKHAAVGFAEWLSVTYGDRGVKVSCLCPMGVNTAMLNAGREAADGVAAAGARAVTSSGKVLEPSEVADAVLAGVAAEQFLILPHPEVLSFWRRKTDDYDRWLSGMRRLQAAIS